VSNVVLVTGSTSGIGLATAHQFAASGMNLVLGDIEQGPLNDAEQDLRGFGARVIAVQCDVSSEEDVEALRDAALAEFGAAHVIFNNAGVVGGPALGTPKSVWDWVMAVNVDGVINGVNAFAPLLLEQNEGHIVNTASLSGLMGVPGTGAYCASKFAVVGISESIFHELALRGSDVGVSVLCPGFVKTRIFESERNMPRELASFNEDPAMKAAHQVGESVVKAGIDAALVARAVDEAVRSKRFWILPHERVALRSTELRLGWMKGGPPVPINFEAAAKA